MMRPSSSYCCCCSLIIILCLISVVYGEGRHARKEIVTTEYGTISSVDGIGIGGWESGRKKYQLQFISLDPNSVFLPAILHAHLVFYVHTGSGKLSYSSLDGGGEMKEVRLRRGDVYSLESGTLFFIHSDLDESHRQRFRINAIFSNADHDQDNWVGPYSFIHHLFRGFDKSLLQAAFQVSEEVIEEITNGSCRTPPIVHAAAASKDETKIKRFVHVMDLHSYAHLNNNNKKKSTKTFNLFKEDPDVKNCNGWSTAVTSKDLPALKASNIGVFMVNLTTNAMMAPHWNPTATEIGVVLEGRGMLRVVCSSNLTSPVPCNNTRFLVEEGDIFVIPRFHPMAHMSFNNETLVFMGFTTSHTNNHPQFLAGEASVLRALNKRMVQLAFNINSTTISKLLSARKGSTILDCVSCAEEEQEIDKREEKVREEERKQQEEEKQRKREKEEEERRCQEEEKRREEEECRRREEEEERRQQEEEEEKRREEEEKRHQEEKEKRRRREEEEERSQEEEEKRRRRREEEEEDERSREEEGEEQKRHQEEKEKQRRREEEEDDERRRQEEEQRRHQDEKERRRRREEEEERREKEEEEEERKEQGEEEEERERGKEEQRRHREQEERRRQREETEEEAARREEEERGRS